MEGPPVNDCCSICHGSFNVPCQANCSHWFCGNCIMLVWHHGSSLHPCKCPLCRRHITLLVPGEASLRERHNSAVAEILEKVEKYNRYFGGQSNGLIQFLFLAETARPSFPASQVVTRNDRSSEISSSCHQSSCISCNVLKYHLHIQPHRHYS
ncbi:hypothetical protein QUC31_001433 [Theobroma cacao]|uniref:E3 ubiquitin-protein ligase RNF170 isoform X2 n=1 Tax=Theobroma cacao TaxID=3641 RepID=A0AB32WRH9_THECC|nr:PREDICTED: E3 ubiquitin-protein ligase RNF170 isoform X2 [Theobroma cacao]